MHLAHFSRSEEPVSLLLHELDCLTPIFIVVHDTGFAAGRDMRSWQCTFIDLNKAISHMVLPLVQVSLRHGTEAVHFTATGFLLELLARCSDLFVVGRSELERSSRGYAQLGLLLLLMF